MKLISIHSQKTPKPSKIIHPKGPNAVTPQKPEVPIMLPQSIMPKKFSINIITFTMHIKVVKDLIELTDSLSAIIARIEAERKTAGILLRQFNSPLTVDDEIKDDKLIIPVSPSSLEGMKIAGVDGGLVKKSFHGIDLMLLRAIGVIFSYDNGLYV